MHNMPTVPPSENHIALFNDSLERCCQRRRRFLDRFYSLFIGASDEVRQKFAHTSMARQKQMLATSLYQMTSAIGGTGHALAALEGIAQIHSKKRHDIRPELYDLWLECLLQAVRDFDPQCSAETERAWRAVMGYGIEFLKQRY